MLEITITCNGETIKYSASELPVTIKQSELVTVVVAYAVEQGVQSDAAYCDCPPETRTSNVRPNICPVCEKPRR